MAVTAYPSWAYNSAGQVAQIVASAVAFAALPTPGTWAFAPYAIPPAVYGPPDVGLTNTDIRLQQLLDESRIQTMMLAQGFLITDDPQTQLRPDVIATDTSIST